MGVYARRSQYSHKENLNDENTERKENYKESFHLLSENLSNHEQILVEIWTVKTIMMRSQMEM